MRMRFKPYARPELLESSFFVETPCENKGRWAECFKNKSPLWLELGCGKGGFAAKLAAREHDVNLIAIDITDKVLVIAKRSIESLFCEKSISAYNIRIMSHDIERIDGMLSRDDSVERIYINFCNPWDKKAGHEKHRLTHTKQLLKYREFMAENGEIWFKCDHKGLFEDSIKYFIEAGFEVIWQTNDLHESEPDWNIRTEHEDMYARQGIRINALIAKKI